MAVTRVINDIPDGLNGYYKRAMIAMKMFGTAQAAMLRADMKKERPWVDRSGDAKRFLDCKFVLQNENDMYFVLSQGVEYGIWLEIAHGKKYAILEPTVRIKGPEVVSNMQGLLDRMGG